jgi:hypothetical protein
MKKSRKCQTLATLSLFFCQTSPQRNQQLTKTSNHPNSGPDKSLGPYRLSLGLLTLGTTLTDLKAWIALADNV